MGSDVVLSAGVRQNLLSLQSTAQLMSITQNRLATGKKVNSALDNPVNFFTSSGLTSRAKDLSALLDSMENGIKTIEAADNGITSIKSDDRIDEVDAAAGAAGQVLQEHGLQRRSHRSGRHRRPDLVGRRGDRLGQRRSGQHAGRAHRRRLWHRRHPGLQQRRHLRRHAQLQHRGERRYGARRRRDTTSTRQSRRLGRWRRGDELRPSRTSTP